MPEDQRSEINCNLTYYKCIFLRDDSHGVRGPCILQRYYHNYMHLLTIAIRPLPPAEMLAKVCDTSRLYKVA